VTGNPISFHLLLLATKWIWKTKELYQQSEQQIGARLKEIMHILRLAQNSVTWWKKFSEA